MAPTFRRREVLASGAAATLLGLSIGGRMNAQTTHAFADSGLIILGQNDHGKTTLAAAISSLHGTGIPYSKIDNAPMVKGLLTEFAMSDVRYDWQDISRNLYDSPGHAGFIKAMIVGDIRPRSALLVVNAADGPMPQTLEHILLAQRVGIQRIVVFLNKTDQVDDDELLELVEMEVRELLSEYDFPGDDIPVVAGSALAALEGRDNKIGETKLVELLASVNEYIPLGALGTTGDGPTLRRTFEAEVYIFSKEEGGRSEPFFGDYSPRIHFSSGEKVGTIGLQEGTEMAMPGDNVAVSITLSQPISIEKFQRFTIKEEGRTVAAGVVSEI